MTACTEVPQELRQLQAQLAAERLARQLAEARLEGFCKALTLLAAVRTTEAHSALVHTARQVGECQSQEGVSSPFSQPFGTVTPSVTLNNTSPSPPSR